MIRAARTILISATLALPLGGCGSVGPDINFDPLDWISGDFFSTKKPLPGDRKALFPEGVPGVARGVPPEIVKGHQPPPDAEDAPQEASLQVEEPKPKPKPKARPKTAAKPASTPPAAKPTAVTVRRPEPQQQQQQAQPPQPAPQQPAAVQWPDPPSTQSQAPAAVQWPDPPPLR
jgi:hypothetical protein